MPSPSIFDDYGDHSTWRLQDLNFLPDNLSSHYFPPSPAHSITTSALYQENPSLAFHVGQLPPPEMYPTQLLDLVMFLENVHNISETNYLLSAEIRDQVQELSGAVCNIQQMTMDVPILTAEQGIEAMVVITNDLWNRECWE